MCGKSALSHAYKVQRSINVLSRRMKFCSGHKERDTKAHRLLLRSRSHTLAEAHRREGERAAAKVAVFAFFAVFFALVARVRPAHGSAVFTLLDLRWRLPVARLALDVGAQGSLEASETAGARDAAVARNGEVARVVDREAVDPNI